MNLQGLKETKGYIMQQLANLGILAQLTEDTGISFNLVNCEFVLSFEETTQGVEIERTTKNEIGNTLGTELMTTFDELSKFLFNVTRLKLGGK
ncbi:hypothetical protein SYYB1_32 [Bacillus phage vB_BaeroP_SYYB1]|uniref:Uncharacterized protein n=1 Tax=Bacillus phage vB_BaeroP_SYYB1 TaxID=2980552 RepID=A0A977SLZ6_9CAUD|nr:hypothetical protein SYYB1_32 [Bacillus phage vB_BaeroP_SYYB1]